VIEDSRRFGFNAPELNLMLGEAQMLRNTWAADTPSYVHAYLDNGKWGRDPLWDNVARYVITGYNCFYLFPEELAGYLATHLQENAKLPAESDFLGHVPLDEILQGELEAARQRAKEAHTAIIRANLRLVSVSPNDILGGKLILDLIQENIGLLRAVAKFDPTLVISSARTQPGGFASRSAVPLRTRRAPSAFQYMSLNRLTACYVLNATFSRFWVANQAAMN
jgi:hypothetical protein